MRVLFVCSGNTCRSAMAEGLARFWALRSLSEVETQKGYSGWEFVSAGTLGIEDKPASENAVIACREIGADISEHRSRGLTKELIEGSDYTFGMENAHIEVGKKLVPGASDKIFLLGAFGPGATDEEVPDPVGMELEYFRKVRDIIYGHLRRILPYLADVG